MNDKNAEMVAHYQRAMDGDIAAGDPGSEGVGIGWLSSPLPMPDRCQRARSARLRKCHARIDEQANTPVIYFSGPCRCGPQGAAELPPLRQGRHPFPSRLAALARRLIQSWEAALLRLKVDAATPLPKDDLRPGVLLAR